MKTLIENLTSDLLPNQIFQTGFSFLIILKGNSLLKLDSNVLIFFMSGTTNPGNAAPYDKTTKKFKIRCVRQTQ